MARRRAGRPGDISKALDGLLRWKLVARHRAGSLEAAVGAARTRNLALSFGVLLLMAVSVGVLARTARRAERLARQQMEFVAAVSHELRTPVSVIGSAAENLADGLVADPARVKQYGTRIQTEARRLGDMVERVLLYAGIEAGHAVGTACPCRSARSIGDAVAASHDTIAEAGVTVEVSVPDGLPPVLGDAAALRSCLANLIANAVKYGGTTRWVGVTARRRQAARDRKCASRSPTRAWASRRPICRTSSSRSIAAPTPCAPDSRQRPRPLLVKRIVEAHGGRVTVHSTPGAGSTFVLHLPACQGEGSPIGTRHRRQPQRTAQHST